MRDIRDGSLADKPSRAKIQLCPLLSESGQVTRPSPEINVGRCTVPVKLRRAEDIALAFQALKTQADALYVAVDQLVVANRTRISRRLIASPRGSEQVKLSILEGGLRGQWGLPLLPALRWGRRFRL